jgi:hypothetical protein
MKISNTLLAIVITLSVLAVSQVSAESTVPPAETGDPIIKDFGADFRYRIINEDNRKLDSEEENGERLWQRFRLRAWTSIRVAPTAELNLRMVVEPRHYNYPNWSSDNYESWVRDEFLFDNLNLTLNDPFELPLKAVLGRQQIQFAENWLVGEGTPLDGTRTAYFDALRTTWNFGENRTSVDLIYIDNRKDSSAYLSPINDFDFDMMEQDERGGIVWISHEAVERRFIDGYFIYKKDHNASAKGVEGETYTSGLRVHGHATDSLSFNAEIAPQFGHKNGKSLSAYAINAWTQQTVSEEKKATVRMGYEFLSGNSDFQKNFDKLWGREGLWSDLYTGGVDGFDGRELDSSNLHRPHIKAVINPWKPLQVAAEYSLLFADKKIDNPPKPAAIDHESMFRGHHVKGSVEHKINKHLKHYVTAQVMIPGNYYSDERQDTATWIRYSVEVKW